MAMGRNTSPWARVVAGLMVFACAVVVATVSTGTTILTLPDCVWSAMAPLQGHHLSGGPGALSACSANHPAGVAALELHCLVAKQFKPRSISNTVDNFNEGYEMFCAIPTANSEQKSVDQMLLATCSISARLGSACVRAVPPSRKRHAIVIFHPRAHQGTSSRPSPSWRAAPGWRCLVSPDRLPVTDSPLSASDEKL